MSSTSKHHKEKLDWVFAIARRRVEIRRELEHLRTSHKHAMVELEKLRKEAEAEFDMAFTERELAPLPTETVR